MSSKNMFLFVAAMLPGALLSSQNEPAVRVPGGVVKPPVTIPAGHSAIKAEADLILSTWLHVASVNEIAVARIAVKQAKSPEVRLLAQDVVDKHEVFAARLQPFTVAPAVKTDKTAAVEPVGKKGPVAIVEASVAAPFDHAMLLGELGKKCLQSQTKMLATKTGTDFDHCWLQMQVAANGRAVDTIEVFQAHASDPLRATLVEGQQVVTNHLEQATRLCKQLTEDDAKKAARARN